jgi:molecular chaperone GrpE
MSRVRKGPVAVLVEEYEKMDAACRKTREDYLRSLAEFDNYRKRVERDSEVSRRLALELLIMDLLPVLDNFDRALKAGSEGQSAENVAKGIELINRQLRDALARHGLESYSCLGCEFDPRKAEAITFVKTGGHKPNTVVDESCKGYSCGGRVIRPARVVVAKATEQKPEIKSEQGDRSQGTEMTSEDKEIADRPDESNNVG